MNHGDLMNLNNDVCTTYHVKSKQTFHSSKAITIQNAEVTQNLLKHRCLYYSLAFLGWRSHLPLSVNITNQDRLLMISHPLDTTDHFRDIFPSQ